MKSRSTYLLVALAALAALYFYAYEQPRGAKQAEEEAAKQKLFDGLVADQVSALELPLKEGGRARVVRVTEGGARWKLEQPLAYAADDAAVDSLVESLASLAAENDVAEIPADLEGFGLGDAARSVQVTLREGEPLVLRIGGKAPLGTTKYVLRDGPTRRLATVSEHLLAPLEPALLTLRDKRVTRLGADEIDLLRITEKGKPLVAAKRGAGEPELAEWALVEPAAEAGDRERIRRLVQDVTFLRATAFVDPPLDLAATGLVAPELSLELGAGERSERIDLARAGGKAYARVAAVNDVAFEVPDRVLADVPRDLFAYRMKRVFALDEAKVSRIDVYFPRDSAQYAFVRRDGTWQAEGSDVLVEPLRLEDVLYALREVDATADLAGADPVKLGLEPPRVRIEPKDASGASLGWLELGDDEGDGVAARSSTGERLWRVARILGDDVPLGHQAFQNRWVKAKPEPAPAAEAGPPGAEPAPELAAEPEPAER